MSDQGTSSASPEARAGVRVETPRLDALLRRLRGALSRGVLLHGLGTVVAAAASWLLFMYAADRLLRLPAALSNRRKVKSGQALNTCIPTLRSSTL